MNAKIVKRTLEIKINRWSKDTFAKIRKFLIILAQKILIPILTLF